MKERVVYLLVNDTVPDGHYRVSDRHNISISIADMARTILELNISSTYVLNSDFCFNLLDEIKLAAKEYHAKVTNMRGVSAVGDIRYRLAIFIP